MPNPQHLSRALAKSALELVRRTIGFTEPPLEPCMDEELVYQPLDSTIRTIHADLPTMLIGGVASLFLQLLYPAVVQGVADHSRYEEDPIGRLQNTGRFLTLTTYGSKEQATAAIARVKHIHSFVQGTTPSGEAYSANDPTLLEWVHIAETLMFLVGYEHFGPTTLTDQERDAYVAQMGQVAFDLGVPAPPRTLSELNQRVRDYLPELSLSPAGRLTRDYLLRGPYTWPRSRGYRTIVSAALELLDPQVLALLDLPEDAPVLRGPVLERRSHRLTKALRLLTAPAHPVNVAQRRLRDARA